jgi:K+ transporter
MSGATPPAPGGGGCDGNSRGTPTTPTTPPPPAAATTTTPASTLARPSLTASLSRVTRASIDTAALRTRTLARASLRAIGLERLAGGGGGLSASERGLGPADRRVLRVQLDEWREDAALRAFVGGHGGEGGAAGGGKAGGGAGDGASAGGPPLPRTSGHHHPRPPPSARGRAIRSTLALAYGAIGIVFGDVLTSPLYTLSAVFARAPPTQEEVQGALSIIFWTLTLILVSKYTLLVLRADDGGQGGTFALYALLRRQGAAVGRDRETQGLSPSVYRRGPEAPAPGRGPGPLLARASTLATASLRRRRGPALDRSSAPPGGGRVGGGDGVSGSGVGGAPAFQPTTTAAPAPPPPPPPHQPRRMRTLGSAAQASQHAGTTPSDAEAGRGGYGPGLTPPTVQKAAAAAAARRDWRQRLIERAGVQAALRVLVAIGVGAILGDGVLTPAISVVSACEGLHTAFPSLPKDGGVVLGASIAILALLFFAQQFGTGAVSHAFSPVGLAWITTLLGLGGFNLVTYGSRALFASLSPHHIVRVFARDGRLAWESLGSLVLCITGAEALYADLGHFSRPAIQISTLVLVYPALIIAYLGQGALLMAKPAVHANVFWSSVPKPVFWPVFVAATAATVVASQALISASFSIVAQAVRQRFMPRLRIVHTSRRHEGQIYIPAVNWMLAILAIAVVAGFRSSEKLGNAYGITVLLDMLLTTTFCSLVMLTVWKLPVLVAAAFFGFFFLVEAAYWSATLLKVPHG